MKYIKTFENYNQINEKFREGTASHYNSLLKIWSEKYNTPYEWKFKDVRGKSQSYFDLKLTHDEYLELSQDAKYELNKLNHQFNVDFKYSRKYWTSIIENNNFVNEDFTDTYFQEGEQFIVKVYKPDEEVAHQETIYATDRDAAFDMAEEIVSKIDGYNEDDGWDYSLI